MGESITSSEAQKGLKKQFTDGLITFDQYTEELVKILVRVCNGDYHVFMFH